MIRIVENNTGKKKLKNNTIGFTTIRILENNNGKKKLKNNTRIMSEKILLFYTKVQY